MKKLVASTGTTDAVIVTQDAPLVGQVPIQGTNGDLHVQSIVPPTSSGPRLIVLPDEPPTLSDIQHLSNPKYKTPLHPPY